MTFVAGFDAEFVLAASQVLDERVPADHHTRSPVGSKIAHWPESCLESSVIPLDPVVPILGRVVEHFWEQVIDVAAFRHRNFDDLVVLVDCALDVAPHTSHLHIGFVDKPAITNHCDDTAALHRS